MCKSDIFRSILAAVADETEIPPERILSKEKCAEVVDARYILIYFLHKRGLYPTTIASMIHYSRRGVEKIVSQFDNRRRQSGNWFEVCLAHIANKLRNTDE